MKPKKCTSCGELKTTESTQCKPWGKRRRPICWPCAKLPQNARRAYWHAVQALETETARQLLDVFDPERKLTLVELSKAPDDL